MTTCPHCNGRGVIHGEPTRRGNALGKLPPYGRDVEQAVRDDTLPWSGVDIFHKPDPANHCRGAIDAWTMAARSHTDRGVGSAMVLPPGEAVSSYRWPAIAVRYVDTPCVVFWAFGCTAAEERAFGEALVAAGYDVVDVRGGPTGPLRFVAT